MGWKGHEITIPFGMLFRKMHCHQCGAKLKKEKITDVYKKGESGYSNRIQGHVTIGMTELAKSQYIYKCPNCNSTISYDQQRIIAKKQKMTKKNK